MKKNTLAIAVGMMLVLGTMAAWACPGGRGQGGRGHGKNGMGMHHRLMEKLDLTETQRAEMKKIREEMRADAKPYREKIKTLKNKMRTLFAADKLNESAILKVQRQIHGVKLQLSELRIQTRIDMYEVLTSSQRAELRELRAKFKAKGGKKGKRGKGHHAKSCGDCPFDKAQ